jgi:uncharacterized protein (DUF433 family)
MTTVEQLEQQVQNLPKEQLAEFRRWFAEYDSEVWDREIEADAAAGKLDALAFLSLTPQLPLHLAEGGVVRVGKTRVTLDVVVEEYDRGATPEDIVRAYDTLSLADVHAVIAYYLQHHDDVRAYLQWRQKVAAALRAEIESRSPPLTRSELLARRAAREQTDAAARQ